jgi:protein O-mannosyl-transferase
MNFAPHKSLRIVDFLKLQIRNFWVLFPLAIAIGVYLPSLFSPYYLDDVMILRDNAWVRSVWPPFGWFGTFFADAFQTFPAYRPILMLSFRLNAFLHDSAASLHTGNLLLHAFNAILVARIFQLFSTSKLSAGLAGLLFFLHPTQTLAVNLIWKRSSILEATFILLCVWLHIREKQFTRPRRSVLALEFLLFVLACLTKESGLILLPILLLIDLLLFKPNRTFHFAFVLWAIAFAAFRFGYMNEWLEENRRFIQSHHDLSRSSYFFSALDVLPHYLKFWLFPSPRIIDDPVATASIPWASAVITLAFFLISIALAVRFHFERSLTLALIWIWCPLGLTLAPVPLFFFLDQIRMYLPLAGFSFLTTIAVERVAQFFGTRKLYWGLAGMILVTYAAHTFLQNREYQLPSVIWRDVVEKYPDSDIGWSEYGIALQDANDYGAAALAFANAARVAPNHLAYTVRALRNMLRSGTPAEEILPVASELNLRDIPVPDLVNLANLFRELHEPEKARRVFLEAVRRNPNFAPSFVEFGALLEEVGEREKALRAYEYAQTLLPNHEGLKKAVSRIK